MTDRESLLKNPFVGIIGFIMAIGAFIFFFIVLAGFFGHFPLYIPVIFLAIGISLLLISREGKEESVETEEDMNYLRSIERFIPLKDPFFSVFTGAFIIALDITYQFVADAFPIGDMDIIIIISGLVLAAYPFFPSGFSLERDFILTFFVFLVMFMILIPLLFDMTDEGFTYYFLLKPIHHILLAMGIDNIIIPPENLRIIDPASQIKSDIVIARACSGIYSFSIFIAASISFILVIYRKMDRNAILFTGLAIFLAYTGNILRMTIVVLSGYHYGQETLELVHSTLGYVIFFGWMALFWFILYRYLIKKGMEGDLTSEEGPLE